MLSSAFAWAEEAPIERSGTLVLSFDRLSGFSHVNYLHEDGQEDYVVDRAYFSLLGARPSSGNGGETVAVHTSPRIAFDAFVMGGLSLGVTGLFWSGLSGGPTSILIGPRIGYAVLLSDVVGVWPRAGISYYRSGVGREETGEYLDVEVPFVLFPNESTAFTVGPVLGYPLGDVSDGSEYYRVRVRHAALMAGLAVLFF